MTSFSHSLRLAAARSMINAGMEEWTYAAIKVEMACNQAEAEELYEDDNGVMTETLVDLVAARFARDGYVSRGEYTHNGKVTLRILFMEDAEG